MKENPKKVPKYSTRKLVQIANDFVNPDLSTTDGVQKYLMGWFCLRFETTLNDERLLRMTLEELIVLYSMHQIKDDPNYVTKVLGPQEDEYEKWLRESMGESYVSEDKQIELAEQEEKDYQKKMDALLPKKITTDFSGLHED